MVFTSGIPISRVRVSTKEPCKAAVKYGMFRIGAFVHGENSFLWADLELDGAICEILSEG